MVRALRLCRDRRGVPRVRVLGRGGTGRVRPMPMMVVVLSHQSSGGVTTSELR